MPRKNGSERERLTERHEMGIAEIKPDGERRTCPNVIAREAVSGGEDLPLWLLMKIFTPRIRGGSDSGPSDWGTHHV